MGLGVEHDGQRHVEVGRGVDVHVAVADAGLDDRHLRLGDDRADQAGAAARDEHVDQAARLHEHLGGVVALPRHQLDGVGRQPGAGDGVAQHRDDRLVAAPGAGGAAQQHGVARLEADAGGVGGDVGAGLVDDADDAEGHPHLAQLEAVGQRRAAQHLPDRVGQGGDLAQAGGHAGDPGLVEAQPVDHRRRGAALLGGQRRPRRWRQDRRRCGRPGRRPSPAARRPWPRARRPPAGRRRPGRRGPRLSTASLHVGLVSGRRAGRAGRAWPPAYVPGGSQKGWACSLSSVRSAAPGVDATLPLGDVERHDLPGRQLGALAVLVPQPQRQGRGVDEGVGLVPVGDLGGGRVEADAADERPLLGQTLQRGPDEQQLDGLSGDCDGDVPQPGFFDHGCPQSSAVFLPQCRPRAKDPSAVCTDV